MEKELKKELERRVDRVKRKRTISVARAIRAILLFVVWGYLFIYNTNVLESDVIAIGLIILLVIFIVFSAFISFVRGE